MQFLSSYIYWKCTLIYHFASVKWNRRVKHFGYVRDPMSLFWISMHTCASQHIYTRRESVCDCVYSMCAFRLFLSRANVIMNANTFRFLHFKCMLNFSFAWKQISLIYLVLKEFAQNRHHNSNQNWSWNSNGSSGRSTIERTHYTSNENKPNGFCQTRAFRNKLCVCFFSSLSLSQPVSAFSPQKHYQKIGSVYYYQPLVHPFIGVTKTIVVVLIMCANLAKRFISWISRRNGF